MTLAGGNTGGGVLAAPGVSDSGYPFTRQGRLNWMCEELRAENWDVTGSLGTLSVELVATEAPPVDEDDDGADH